MIDTHAHLTDPKFSDDVENVVNSAVDSGVEAIISVATRIDDSRKCIALKRIHPAIHSTVGIHPHEAGTWNDASSDEISSLAPQSVAIGEIGLDYFYNFFTHERQRTVFIRQMDLALQLSKPVIIHCRDALDDLTAILRSFGSRQPGGVIHCFTGSIEEALPILELGYYFSFGGMLTFHSADVIRDTACKLPINRILLETDCPYLAPIPMRGKRNTPQFIRFVYEKLSELRNLPIEELITSIRASSRTCFRDLSKNVSMVKRECPTGVDSAPSN